MVVSSKVERLTPVLEGLRSLLFPLQWPHVYITNLFLALADFINAPMPFLIGVLRHVFSDLDVPDDVIVFDVDIDEVRVCSQMPPPFPQQHMEFLSNALQVRKRFFKIDRICPLCLTTASGACECIQYGQCTIIKHPCAKLPLSWSIQL
jgi:hypothetical protein